MVRDGAQEHAFGSAATARPDDYEVSTLSLGSRGDGAPGIARPEEELRAHADVARPPHECHQMALALHPRLVHAVV